MAPITREEFLSRLRKTKERIRQHQMEMRLYYQEMCKANAAAALG